jgi:outer membrane protein OmpA-like peptidoglycan-associated protein/tetratricopeptide (TPR) repeat protein
LSKQETIKTKLMKKILALIVTAIVISNSFAGGKKMVDPDKRGGTVLKIADRYYAESYYYTAAGYYRDVVRTDSANRYATFWLAMSLYQARDYENAEVFFRQFYEMKPGEKANKKKWDDEDRILFNKGDYYFGEVLHRNGKYDEAIEHLGKFMKSYVPKDPKDPKDNLKKLAQNEIDGCEFAKHAPKAKVKVINAGAGVNKLYNEGAPRGIGENDLYYSSLRPGVSDSLQFVKGPKAQPIYAIYHSVKDGNTWGKGTALESKDVNSPGYNVGNGAFNRDMSRFYFTKCLDVDDNRSLCNIYVADYNGGAFSNVTRLPEPVNAKEAYTSTQPAVRTSDDGSEMIYYVSDRPGGVGGMDIWFATRMADGGFKDGGLVKGPINTPGDELTPYFEDSTKTLYFSSDGHPGLGGFDVFKSTENADLSWTDPVNVGAPINSGADDLYFSRSNDLTYGFLVSNRAGSVPLNGIKTASDDVFYWTNFRYAVKGTGKKEGDDGGVLTDAKFELYRKNPDGTRTLVSVESPDSKTGNMAGGNYFFKLQPETDYEVVMIRPGFQNKVEEVTTKGLPGEDTLTDNIFTRKSVLTVKGLISEEGKGSLKDANVELVEIAPSGMEKTLYYMKSDPYYYFDIELDHNYKIVTRKEGYFTNTLPLPTSTATMGKVDTLRKDIALKKVEMNIAYTLQNVLYEFGKATLTENSKLVLDNLYQLMVENPKFVIELSAHTDAIGSDAGNMKLSQARAESCVKYLVGKGIASDRMIAKGYGKTKPKVPNTTEDGKDDPAGRAINRRTEFQIVGMKKEQ